MQKHTVSIFIAALFLIPSLTHAQLSENDPWPKFHKDVRNTGKTSNFGTDVGKLKWKVITEGPVTSSPAVCLDNDGNEVVYIGSADNRFYAIDAESGTIEWTYETEGAIEFTSPACDKNKVVYVGSNDGTLYAFDTTKSDPSDPKWTYETGGAISGSPTIDADNNIIFTSNDGYIYNLKSNGTLNSAWSQLDKSDILRDGMLEIGASWSTPAIDEVNNQLYIGSWRLSRCYYDNETFEATTDNQSGFILGWNANFFAYDLSSGDEQWVFPCSFCPPGGILASPSILPDNSLLVSYFTTYANDGCPGDLHEYNIYRVSKNGNAQWLLDLEGQADIYGTPAILEDNSFFVPAGSNLYRVLPEMATYYAAATVGERIESSPAIDGRKLAFIGSNGGYFYCVNADAPETPLVWQYPAQGEDPLQTQDGLTIASVVSSPAIGADDRHSVYVGASDGCVYAFYDGPRIAGKVELAADNGTLTPLRSVMLTMTSEFTDEVRVTYTGTDGTYSFPGVENFTYTVTPSKLGYIFREEFELATVKFDRDVENVNFIAFTGATVKGKVIDETGVALSGVTVVLEGRETGYKDDTTTDSNGEFTFDSLNADTYTATPSLDGYGFTPSSQSLTIDDSNVFSVTPIEFDDEFEAVFGFQISGRVFSTASGEGEENGIANISISLSGNGQIQTDQTDALGNYSFAGLDEGTYTVTPSTAGTAYTFLPESREVIIDLSNADNVNFQVSTGISISGKIIHSDNESTASVSVGLYEYNQQLNRVSDNATATVSPDSSGKYVFIEVEENKTFMVKPLLKDTGFDPLYRIVETTTGKALTDINFNLIEGLYIAGRVTDLAFQPVEGITVNLSGTLTGSTFTDSAGQYVFTGLSEGKYNVSLELITYSSFDASEDIDLTESTENIDFRIRSTCTVPLLNIPFAGGYGTIVNIYGLNFGWEQPDETETVLVEDESIPSGVYFVNMLAGDPSDWVSADVMSWTNFKIVVRAPSGIGLARIVVARVTNEAEGYGCGQHYLSNFFLYIR